MVKFVGGIIAIAVLCLVTAAAASRLKSKCGCAEGNPEPWACAYRDASNKCQLPANVFNANGNKVLRVRIEGSMVSLNTISNCSTVQLELTRQATIRVKRMSCCSTLELVGQAAPLANVIIGEVVNKAYLNLTQAATVQIHRAHGSSVIQLGQLMNNLKVDLLYGGSSIALRQGLNGVQVNKIYGSSSMTVGSLAGTLQVQKVYGSSTLEARAVNGHVQVGDVYGSSCTILQSLAAQKIQVGEVYGSSNVYLASPHTDIEIEKIYGNSEVKADPKQGGTTHVGKITGNSRLFFSSNVNVWKSRVEADAHVQPRLRGQAVLGQCPLRGNQAITKSCSPHDPAKHFSTFKCDKSGCKVYMNGKLIHI